MEAMMFSPLLAPSLRGKHYQGLMHVTDWFPTLLSIANVKYAPAEGARPLDGIDQKDALLSGDPSIGPDSGPRGNILYNYYDNSKVPADSRMGAAAATWLSDKVFAVRNGQYKLVHALVDSSSGTEIAEGGDDDPLCAQQLPQLHGSHRQVVQKFLFDVYGDPFEDLNLYNAPGFEQPRVSGSMSRRLHPPHICASKISNMV